MVTYTQTDRHTNALQTDVLREREREREREERERERG